jgi:hypothetical protein
MSAVVTYSDSATLENPALAGSSKRRTLGTWAVRMYGLRELQVFGIAGRVATGRLGAGARIISFGFDRYAEERLEFHAGGRIGPATEVTGPGYAAGAGLTLERRSNASGGARLTWKGRAGMILPLSSSWVLGTVVSKPLGSGGDGEPERAGSILIGGATQVAEYVRLAFDLYFEPPFKPSER